MATTYRIADLLRDIMADAMAPEFNNGYLRIYDGARPATPGTALAGNTLLAELRYNATAFAAAVAGVLAANAITGDAAADAGGTATFYRSFASDGTTVLDDGEIGTAGANMNLPTTTITIGQPVNVTSLQTTVPMQQC